MSKVSSIYRSCGPSRAKRCLKPRKKTTLFIKATLAANGSPLVLLFHKNNRTHLYIALSRRTKGTKQYRVKRCPLKPIAASNTVPYQFTGSNFFIKQYSNSKFRIMKSLSFPPPPDDNYLIGFIMKFVYAVVQRNPKISDDTLQTYADLFGNEYKDKRHFEQVFNGVVNPPHEIQNTPHLTLSPKDSEMVFKQLNSANEESKVGYQERFIDEAKGLRLLRNKEECDVKPYLNNRGFQKVPSKQTQSIIKKLSRKTNINKGQQSPRSSEALYQKDDWVVSIDASDHTENGIVFFKLWHMTHGFVTQTLGPVLLSHNPGNIFKQFTKDKSDIFFLFDMLDG